MALPGHLYFLPTLFAHTFYPHFSPHAHRLQDLVNPTTETGSQGFVDLGFTPDGALLPETMRVWQFSLTPLKVEGVGPTGMNGVGGWGRGAGSGGETRGLRRSVRG